MKNGLPHPLFDAIILGLSKAPQREASQAALSADALLEIAARARLLAQAGGDPAIAAALVAAGSPDLSGHTASDFRDMANTRDAARIAQENDALAKSIARVKSSPNGFAHKAFRNIMQLGRIDVLHDLSANLPKADKQIVDGFILRVGGDALGQWHANARPLDLLRIGMRSVLTSAPSDTHAQDDVHAAVRTLMAGDQIDAALSLAVAHKDQIEGSQALAVSMVRTLFQLIPPETFQSDTLHRALAQLPPFVRFTFLSASDQAQAQNAVPLIHAAGQSHDVLRISRSLVAAPVDTVRADETVDALNALLAAIAGRPSPHVNAARGLGYDAGPRLKPLASAVITPDDIAAQSEIAPAFEATLADLKSRQQGLVMITSHNTPRPPWNYLPPIATAQAGFDAVTVIKEKRMISAQAGRYLPLDEDGIVWRSKTGQLREVARRDMSEAEQIAQFMGLLRAGGAVQMSPDGAFMPSRVRAYVPWFLRNYYLPVFGAQLALSTGAAVIYAQAWRCATDQGDARRISDCEPVEIPPRQGSLAVRSIWLTQRVARAARLFHRRTGAPLDTEMLYNYGGAPQPATPRATPHAPATLTTWIGQDQSDTPALMCFGRSLGRADLARYALRLAAMLQEAQSEHPSHHDADRCFGDQFRLFACLPQGEALIALGLAAHATGCLFSPCQSDAPPDQIAARALDFRPHLIIASADSWSAVLAADPSLASVPVLIVENEGGQAALDELCDGYFPAKDLPAVAPDQPGFVLYTSGSTGRPKGVVVPAGVLEGAGGLDRTAKVADNDRVAYVLRWDTVGFVDLLACLRGGACLAVPDPDTIAKPRAFWDWIARDGVTFVSAPVTMWRYLAQAAPAVIPAAFSGGLLWGERVPAPLVAQLEDVCPKCRLDLILGATECTYIGYGRAQAGQFSAFTGGPGGHLLADRIAQVLDADGTPMAQGQTGILRLTAPAVMFGLFADLMAQNAQIDPAAWPATTLIGNQVRFLDQGIDVLGRADDVIKIAGRRLTIAEVDSAVEGVDGITRSCTFLVEDPSGDVWLAVAAQTDQLDDTDLARRAADRVATQIFAAARPRRVVLFETFARLPTGKLDTVTLRRALLEGDQQMSAPPQAPDTPPPDARDLPPIRAALSDWATSRGFLRDAYSPLAALPSFSSIDQMELHLLAEEVAGAARLDPINVVSAATWADLEAALTT